MTSADYFRVLGIPSDSSINDIKKAYRTQARLFHPDINPDPAARDKFIHATEAYEFLIANFNNISSSEEAYLRAAEDWRKYRQDRSRQRARAYAQASYIRFRKTSFYRTTRIFDATAIIFSLVISILTIIYTIFGYTYRLHNPLPGVPNPTIISFLGLLLMGMLFFVISFIFLRAHIETSKKHRRKSGHPA
jgi:hypothetical protein